MIAKDIKEKVLKFILKRESIFRHLFIFFITLIGLIVINKNYGYMGVLNNDWIVVAVSLLCAFIPINFAGLIMFLILSIHLFFLSVGVCFSFLLITLAFFIMASFCGAKSYYHLILMPILYTVHLPFLAPIYEGYFGKRRNIIPLIGGSVLAFFLRSVKIAEAAFKSKDENYDAFTLLKDNILSNKNFYLFIIAVGFLFLIISLLKGISLSFAWYFAGLLGVLIEFIIVLIGYIFSSVSGQTTTLVISNIVSILFVLLIAFLFSDTKVHKRRVLSFEDDNYDYYVICTPKVQIEDTKKKVVRITRSKQEIEKEIELQKTSKIESTKE